MNTIFISSVSFGRPVNMFVIFILSHSSRIFRRIFYKIHRLFNDKYEKYIFSIYSNILQFIILLFGIFFKILIIGGKRGKRFPLAQVRSSKEGVAIFILMLASISVVLLSSPKRLFIKSEFGFTIIKIKVSNPNSKTCVSVTRNLA